MLAVLLCAGMLMGSLVGCSSSDTTSDSSSSDVAEESLAGEGVTIAFVISDLTNEVFVELMDACAEEAEAVGAEFTFIEAQEVADKITAIENLTNAGTDVIISHVSDPTAMQPTIEAAQAAGSKFIAYDTDTETSDAFFGADNYALGQYIGFMAAEWINETFDSSETVKVGMANYPEFNFLVIRENGIIDALAEAAPNAEIVVSQQAGFIVEGVDVGEVWLQSEPDLNVVVGINDSGVVGVYQSFIAGGVDSQDSTIGMFGCDATSEALRLMEDNGIFRGTVTTSLVAMAPDFIETSVKLANDEEVEHDVYFPMDVMKYNEETGEVEIVENDFEIMEAE